MKKYILLTFDLEEFDLPLEYRCFISEKDQFRITGEGLQVLMKLLDKYWVKATFFTTSNYCEKNPSVVKMISGRHEIASHSHFHSKFEINDYVKSRGILEGTIQKKVWGFRMPLLRKTDEVELKKAGYLYDSSINPTFIPGRYNHFFKPRKLHYSASGNIIRFPLSVLPLVRFPLFWLSFKNLPLPVYLFLCRITLNRDSYLHLYFHPWEFAGLENFRIPGYIKRPSGEAYTGKFEKLLISLEKMAEFVSVYDYIESIGR